MATIEVRLTPRGGRDELLGMREGVLLARVAAPPVDGRANAALCRLIAKRAGVARSRVTILRGEKARDKIVQVERIDEQTLLDALANRD
jgi:uncharacterized protein